MNGVEKKEANLFLEMATSLLLSAFPLFFFPPFKIELMDNGRGVLLAPRDLTTVVCLFVGTTQYNS